MLMTTTTQYYKEAWVTKKELATHFRFSTRWVELRVCEGLPHVQFGAQKRFRISECETWLLERNQ